MATQKLLSDDAQNAHATNDEVVDEEAWESPSSSPDKKILTGKALLESGLVGLWKDRTDIGDTLEFARKLRERANKRCYD